MYTLYGFPNTRSFRVLWALEEAQVNYDYQVVNLYQGEHKQANYLALSPMAKVPLLKTPEGVLAESPAILAYLAAHHGAPLLPDSTDLFVTGKVFEMQSFIACELEQPLWTMAKHTFALPEERRVKKVKETAKWEYERALKVFSSMLNDNAYATGTQFSYADILAVHTLNWAKNANMPCQFDNVKHYCETVMRREAYQRALQKEQEKLASFNK
ncbi:glutathione S-transferase family protein [Alteromonas sediminis]|uniref:Glutathione S-transferase family protein n=1 Tax=Alteromonas sediminis TaxID=2259342 RepID=A0A3N5ZD70_9ALTE|nr:glutathione S-transferase family protein [Alteromonas sediminis]RPJ67908.1 glutathione S-transferase family protein [Alteromonas sediminis]